MRYHVPDTDLGKQQINTVMELTDAANTLALQMIFGRSDIQEHHREQLISAVAELLHYRVVTLEEIHAALNGYLEDDAKYGNPALESEQP